jgi:hypothetical protein
MAVTWRRGVSAGVLAVVLGLVALASAPSLRLDSGPLPERLSNKDFWGLVESLSEPSGYFQSDNLVSNEHTFQYVVPSLQKAARPGRVYIGVAPDQNFTYLLALKPELAFIVDIRRGNLQTQLMYKALIELSDDRADFVGRLFARPRPDGLTTFSTVDDIFKSYALTISNRDIQAQTFAEMVAHLTDTRGFRLSAEDLAGIEDIHDQFVRYGPSITYSCRAAGGRGGVGGRGRGRSNFPTYADLMRQNDGAGVQRSYLATEEQFQALKTMQERNLIVPVVGDFAGSKPSGRWPDGLHRLPRDGPCCRDPQNVSRRIGQRDSQGFHSRPPGSRGAGDSRGSGARPREIRIRQNYLGGCRRTCAPARSQWLPVEPGACP